MPADVALVLRAVAELRAVLANVLLGDRSEGVSALGLLPPAAYAPARLGVHAAPDQLVPVAGDFARPVHAQLVGVADVPPRRRAAAREPRVQHERAVAGRSNADQ